jgi:tetratricopeptide (TPR) repeat protein
MGPIEPAAITAATLLATKAMEALGGKAGETTWAGMGRLVALVRRRFGGHHRAESTLAELDEHPEDADRIRDLAELLTSFAAQDAAFRRELVELVTDARHDPSVGPLATEVYGQAQVGQILNVAWARDIYIQPSSAGPRSAAPTVEAGWPAQGRTVSNLPPRNPVFTGRDGLVTALEERLGAGPAAAVVQPQALHGLGGVGKTQLALEHAYRHAGDYDMVWWVAAEQPAAIPGQLVALARRLGLNEQVEQAETVAVLLDELRHHDRWLLIFDNAEQPQDLRPFWPSGAGGHVLVTSRNPSWGGLATTVQVDVLRRSEAVMFLERRAALDTTQAAALAEALGDLPLALEQAAAYLEETSTPADDYLDLLRDRAPELLALGQSANAEQTIATTWTVSLDRIRAQAPAAQDLLTLCAFLAPEDLPRSLLTEHPDRLPEPPATAVGDQIGFQQALGALRRYSLATVTTEAVSVHRLVQAVTRHALDVEPARAWAAAAVRLVWAGFPGQSEDVQVWPVAAQLLSHALAATEHASAFGADPEATAALLYECGRYLWGRAEHVQAKMLHERALAIRETRLGPNHPLTGTSLNALGNVLRDLGDFPAARSHLERALVIRESRLGPRDPHTANTLNNLALVLRDLGDLAAARTFHERALAIREDHFGQDYPQVALSLNNLGHVLHDLGDLTTARRHHQRALAIYEAQLGPDHPNVARSLDHLGAVLTDLGELAAAHTHHQRALAIRQARLGPNHPDTATSLYNLGIASQGLGNLDEARASLEQARAIYEAALGPDHPQTAHTLRSLAGVLRDQGNLQGARILYERALALREEQFGPDHPQVATNLNHLAKVLADQGDLPGARSLHERGLAIREAHLGSDHPDTAASLHNLANVLQAQGDLDHARTLHQRALAIREARLGPDHPDTAWSLHNLAIVLHDQGDLRAARSLHERALTIRETRLGADHPDTAWSLHRLATMLVEEGDLPAARSLHKRALGIREAHLGPDHPTTATSRRQLDAVEAALEER